MCAIAGILANSPNKVAISQMLASMKHRGPDDNGIWIEGNVSLGHNRLAIIDLSPGGHQPMSSASERYVMVYNGEVYNFQSLRATLEKQGVYFQSNSDTEVILALWEREQEACLSKLRGIFALSVWDRQEKKLTLVRDRLGIKPLYYAHWEQGILFASEIKGMLASGLVNKAINPVAISQLLNTGYIQQPDTILTGVYALPAGHLMVWQNGQTHIQPYWEFKNATHSCRSEQDAIICTRELVMDAVSEEMIADRPIGIFLSGGLDSTLLLAALQMTGHRHVKTFSIGFESQIAGLNETNNAVEAAEFYASDHTAVQTDFKSLSDDFDDFLEALDQPSIDGLNTWLVSKHTARHVTVALSGLGGDELFSGYGFDRRLLYEKRKYGAIIQSLDASRIFWEFLPKGGIRRRLDLWSEKANLSNAYSQWGRIFSSEQSGRLFNANDQYHRVIIQNAFAKYDVGKNFDYLQRISGLHLSTFMSSRLLRDSDAVSMAHSLEVRFPLIDHRLVELAFALPLSWKMKNIKTVAKLKQYESENAYAASGVKHLLYQAFKEHLPPEFGNRPKHGFHLPMQEWLQLGMLEKIRSYLTASDTFFNQNELTHVWNNWQSGRVSWNQVWLLFIIEYWIKKYLKN